MSCDFLSVQWTSAWLFGILYEVCSAIFQFSLCVNNIIDNYLLDDWVDGVSPDILFDLWSQRGFQNLQSFSFNVVQGVWVEIPITD